MVKMVVAEIILDCLVRGRKVIVPFQKGVRQTAPSKLLCSRV